MRITIIDARDVRREHLAKLARQVTKDVNPVPFGTKISQDIPSPDLVLLHVGVYQEDNGDVIADLLDRFQPHSWILCYYGGEPVEAATRCTSLAVAVFPAPVDQDDPGPDLARTIHKVLSMLPERSSLPEGSFRSVVTGFDILLEAKLDVLTSVLCNITPLADHLAELRKIYPQAFGDEGELLVPQEDLLQSVADLRKLFFNETSQVGDA